MTTVAATTTEAAATTTTDAATTTTESTTTTTVVATTTTTAPPIELTGRSFVSTAVTGFEFVPGTQASMGFSADEITATFGCNEIYAGPWSLDDGALVVGEAIGTEIGCNPPALNDQEVWLGALLTSDPAVTFDGTTLTLTEGASSITFLAQP